MSNKSKFEQSILLDRENIDLVINRVKELNKGFWEFQFDKLIRIENAEPETLINLLTSISKEEVEPFLALTPAQISVLEPVLKIWHIDKDGNEVQIKLKENYEEKNILLRRFYSEQAKTRKSDKEFLEILNENESSGVGIKNLTLVNRNERPGDVNIQCDIEMVFDDILSLLQGSHKELFRVPPIIDGSNSVDFRLKLLIGWSLPSNVSHDTFFPKELLKSLERTQQVFLLALVQHNLSFNKNGSINLKLEYQGAMENLFYSRDSDLISLDKLLLIKDKTAIEIARFDSEFYTKAEDDGKVHTVTPQEIEDDLRLDDRGKYTILRMREKTYIDKINELYKQNENVSNEIEKNKDELDNVREQITNIRERTRKQRYALILDRILQKAKLYYAKVNKFAYSNSYNLKPYIVTKLMLDKLFDIGVGNLVKEDYTSYGIPKVKSCWRVSDFERRQSESALQYVRKKAEDLINENSDKQPVIDQEAEFNDVQEEKQLMLNSLTSGVSAITNVSAKDEKLDYLLNNSNIPQYEAHAELDQEKIIHYIMFGDILEIAAEFLGENKTNNVILGPVRLRNDDKIINLAEIPIPLESFTEWFVSKVTGKNKDKWYFKEFISDVLNQLITPYMTGIYNIPGSKVKFNLEIETFYSPYEIGKGRIISENSIKSLLLNSFYNKTHNPVYCYFLIYATNTNFLDLKGDYNEDLEKGIYHMNIGTDSGIVIDMNLRKIDNNKLRTARLTSDVLNKEGEFLREHYNCDLELVGNHLFQPGKLFFMNSSYLGNLGIANAHIIGLGGYYQTTEVKHTITENKFKTNIGGFWQDLGTGKGIPGSISENKSVKESVEDKKQ